jgi:hypothetical protein
MYWTAFPENSDFALAYAFQFLMQVFADQQRSAKLLQLDGTSNTSPAIATQTPKPKVVLLGLTQDARGLNPGIASLFDATKQDIPHLKSATVNFTAFRLGQL